MAPKTALAMYKQDAGPGFLNLKAIPNHLKGIRIYMPSCEVWGEKVTDAECFRRKLKGTLLDGLWEYGND